MRHDNQQIFRESTKKLMIVVNSAFDAKFIQLAQKLFKDLCISKFYPGYTGNTQRSYTAAYFLDGELRYMIQGKDIWTYHEIRGKILYKQRVYLKRPYEGDRRLVEGKVEVDDYYGYQTAMNYVMQNHLDKGFQVIVGVGTEYYPYLLQERLGIDSVEEQVEYFLQQDRLLEKMFKQVSGMVSMELSK